MSHGRILTIEPDRITTLEEWSRAFGSYANLILENGRPAVTSREDVGVPVKYIPLQKGADLYAVLQSEQGSEHREAAIELLSAKTEALAEKAVASTAQFLEAERQLLEMTDVWKLAPTPSAKRAAALNVGKAAAAVAAADAARRPHRRELSVSEVTRVQMDYRTKDERVYPTFHVLQNPSLLLADRVLIEGDRA
jgi:hypothetical protein